MIRFDYKEEKEILVAQEYVGEDVDVQIRNDSGDVECEFAIPAEDFVEFLNKYKLN